MKIYIFLFFAFLSFFATAQQSKKLSSYDSLKVMPPFQYYTTDGKLFTQSDLNKKKYSVFIYIKIGCSYCEDEVEIIKKNIDNYSHTQFYLISRADTSELKKLYSEKILRDYPQIKILCDKDKLYYTYTIAHYTPSIHIYNRKRKLLNFTDGLMNEDELLKYIN